MCFSTKIINAILCKKLIGKSKFLLVVDLKLNNFGLNKIIMKNHFDLKIDYNKRSVEINVQILSGELPKIIYSVKPKDEELIKHFNNVKQFYFHINSVITYNKLLEIKNYVIYDYIDPSIKNTDIAFEFAVWKNLLTYTIREE